MLSPHYMIWLHECSQTSHQFNMVMLRPFFRNYGVLSLFKGLEAKLLQTVLTAALMFLLYENMVSWIYSVMGLNNNASVSWVLDHNKHWLTFLNCGRLKCKLTSSCKLYKDNIYLFFLQVQVMIYSFSNPDRDLQ